MRFHWLFVFYFSFGAASAQAAPQQVQTADPVQQRPVIALRQASAQSKKAVDLKTVHPLFVDIPELSRKATYQLERTDSSQPKYRRTSLPWMYEWVSDGEDNWTSYKYELKSALFTRSKNVTDKKGNIIGAIFTIRLEGDLLDGLPPGVPPPVPRTSGILLGKATIYQDQASKKTIQKMTPLYPYPQKGSLIYSNMGYNTWVESREVKIKLANRSLHAKKDASGKNVITPVLMSYGAYPGCTGTTPETCTA